MARSAVGCKLCAKGAKLVLFVSGKCNRRCFYCPLSEKKKGRDVVYANERPVRSDYDIIEEAYRMRALGTGITGGEPLIFMDRTVHFMQLLKNEFGEKHHLHLYTTMPVRKEEAERLHSNGLDEIRFHIIGKAENYERSVEASKNAGLSVGVELPAIDEKKIEQAIALDIDFLNLNELEFSETNREKMNERGFDTENGICAIGSAKIARRIMRRYSNRVPINFCSSNFKDGVQLRRRLLRTAMNVAKSYEAVTSDGTIIRGVIELELESELKKERGIKRAKDIRALKSFPELKNSEIVDGRIYTSAEAIEKIAEKLPESAVAYISEVYPTWDGLEVERSYIKGFLEKKLEQES
jgi:hypothetical protein